jgi:hypothetical protein
LRFLRIGTIRRAEGGEGREEELREERDEKQS